jgi:LysM repeat protein
MDMKRNPTLLEGLLISLLVVILVTGAVILAGFENLGFRGQAGPANESIPVANNPGVTETPAAVESIPTEIPSPTVCPPPEGWLPYEMKSGDSLQGLAGERLTDLSLVMAGNCLIRPGALPGTIIYLPPPPPTLTPTITFTPTISQTPTITLRACDYPENWVRYSLKSGDTLFKLGVLFKTSEVDLLTGNCLSFGNALHEGDILLVPRLPIVTVTPKN